MRTTSHYALGMLLCLAPAAIAWRPAAEPLRLEPQSRLWIDGTSTVRKFTCNAPAFSVAVDAAPDAVSAVLAGTKAVRTVTVRVPAAKMECGNDTMNEHMRKALKASEAPTIEFRLTGYDVARSGAGAAGTLNGTLSVGGTQRPVSFAARALGSPNGALRVVGTYALHMKEFGLTPPSLMMGTMKVGELVTVHFDLVLRGTTVVATRPAPTAAAPAETRTAVAPSTTPAPSVARATAAAPTKRAAPPTKPVVRDAPLATPSVATATAPITPPVRDSVVPPVEAADTATTVSAGQVAEPSATPPLDSATVAEEPAAIPDLPQRAPSDEPPLVIQRIRPGDRRGINVFEAPKDDTMPYTGFRLGFGAAFTQQFQALDHRNTADAVVTNGVNTNQLMSIGHGFNNAVANGYVNAQLGKGIRLALTSYLSARHHNEVWIKDGYALVDASPIDFAPLNRIMEYVTLKAGHFEINYGDAHFRRTDNGQAMFNPLVGNYIMDAFTTEVGGEAYLRGRGRLDGMFLMGAATNGEVRGTILNKVKRAPAFYGKVGFDRQMTPTIRGRLTGTLFSQARANAQTLYNGDRGGSRYYDVLENISSSESAQAWSGSIQPFSGVSTGLHAAVVNPFLKYKGLEYFGNFERAKGRSLADSTDRTMTQLSNELTYRLFGDALYVSGRYNTVTGRLTGMTRDINVRRTQLGGGWFVTPLILTKVEYVSQKYFDFPSRDIRNGGQFKGFVAEGVIAF